MMWPAVSKVFVDAAFNFSGKVPKCKKKKSEQNKTKTLRAKQQTGTVTLMYLMMQRYMAIQQL